MENKNVMLEESIYIKTTPTVLETDKLALLAWRYQAKEIGDIVYNLECIRILLSNDTNPAIVDEILNSKMDDETLERISSWFEKVAEALNKVENSKKKQEIWSPSTKETWKSSEEVKTQTQKWP